MDFSTKHENILAMRHEKSCEWFLHSTAFTKFIAHTENILWATGMRM